jgi:uncharacterized lipoprotein
LIVVIAAMVAVSSACSSSQPAAPMTVASEDAGSTAAPAGPQAAVSGQTLHISTPEGSAAYTVDNLQPVPAEAVIIPAKGTLYAVDVTIQGESGTTTVNGFYFVARAEGGAVIAPSVGAVNPGITSGQLAEGQKMAGHLAFDVAPGQSIVQITLRDPKGNPLAAWSLA